MRLFNSEWPGVIGTSVCVGPCYKVHDESLRRSYVESDMKGKLGYEADFLAYLERIIRDLDRKIHRGQDRLRRSAEAKQQVSPHVSNCLGHDSN